MIPIIVPMPMGRISPEAAAAMWETPAWKLMLGFTSIVGGLFGFVVGAISLMDGSLDALRAEFTRDAISRPVFTALWGLGMALLTLKQLGEWGVPVWGFALATFALAWLAPPWFHYWFNYGMTWREPVGWTWGGGVMRVCLAFTAVWLVAWLWAGVAMARREAREGEA